MGGGLELGGGGRRRNIFNSNECQRKHNIYGGVLKYFFATHILLIFA